MVFYSSVSSLTLRQTYSEWEVPLPSPEARWDRPPRPTSPTALRLQCNRLRSQLCRLSGSRVAAVCSASVLHANVLWEDGLGITLVTQSSAEKPRAGRRGQWEEPRRKLVRCPAESQSPSCQGFLRQKWAVCPWTSPGQDTGVGSLSHL